jgi:hypothetical protein
MKRNLVLLWAVLLGPALVYAQNPIAIHSREVGTDLRTNSPLIAKEYQFDQPVYRFFPSENKQAMTVLVRRKDASATYWKPKGEAKVIDPESGRQIWSKKVNFPGTTIQTIGDAVYEQRGNKLSKIALADGKPLWKRKTFMFMPIPSQNVALCYDVETGFQKLVGIDMVSGGLMWRRDVSGELGWESAKQVNDSTVLITAGGLHTVGAQDGLGWDINRVTHVKKTDMKKVGLALLTGVAGAAAGYMVIPGGDFSDYFLHLSSNVLYDGDVFYFAAKEKLTCHSLDGKKLWEAPLNGKITTKSHLFQDGNTIYLVNKGYGMKYGWPAALGNPYVAAFDADSGEQLFYKEWDERKNFVSDYLVEGNELFLLYKDKLDIQKFSPEGLSQRFVSRMDTDVKMKEFVSEQIFIRQDSAFQQPSHDREHFYIFSENYDLYRFANDFESNEKLDKKSLYRNYLETDAFLFLGNERETFIVDKHTLKEVARCEATVKSTIIDCNLYYTKGSKLLEMDISAFGKPGFAVR